VKLKATIFAAIIAVISLTHSTGAVTVGSDWSIKTFQSTVTVLDHNGDPLDGARVDLLRANGSATGKWAKTGADGSGVAGFDILPGFSHAFKVTWNRGFIVTGLLDPDEDVVVETHLSQIVLQKKTGEPIEGARVDMLLPDGTATGKWMKSQADGSAGFETLPGCNAMFKVTYHGDSFVSDLVPCGHVATLEVGVAANTIEATLADSAPETGNPIEGARFYLLKENGKGAGVWQKTDAAGQVSFDVVPGAKHKVKVSYHGGTYVTGLVSAGAQVPLRTVPSTLTLTDSEGAPIDSVRVYLMKTATKGAGVWTKTGRGAGSGVAHFEVLPGFAHQFKVSYHGGNYVTQTAVTVATGESHNESVQTVASSLVLNNSENTSIDSARVYLMKTATKGAGPWTKTGRGDAGTGVAHFEVLPGFAHQFKVSYHGGTYVTPTAIEIAESQTHSETVQTVPSALVLSDSKDAGLDSVRIDLMKSATRGAGVWTKTGRNGAGTGVARFEVLPGWAHQFRVSYRGATQVPEAVVVIVPGGNQNGSQNVAVSTVSSELTMMDGLAEMANLRVDLLKSTGSGAGAWTRTDSAGVAAFEVLSSFEHKIRARVGSLKYSTEVLLGDEDATIDISTTPADDGTPPAAKLAAGPGEGIFGLNQNHPNPFNPSTTINYGLAEASDVRLVIYNVLGQEVKVLVSEYLPMGAHSIQWDGRDAIGRTVASGTYIYRLAAGDKVAIKKMIFAK
jgi:hypothetical protein